MTTTASGYALQRNDLYQTPRWVVDALLRHFPVDDMTVWEPAAGNHAIAGVLIENGASVITSDIETYDVPHRFIYDFHTPGDPELIVDLDAIITNPPYGKQNRLAAQFCALALQRCDGLVAMLCTAKFDSGNTRHNLFRDNPRFAAKIVLVDRISWFNNGDGGTEDHAWFVWRSYQDSRLYPAAWPRLIYEENTMKDFNVNNPIGVWAAHPEKYLDQGWYDLGGNRGRWFFKRRDPVVVTDAYGRNPTLCHINFLTLDGTIMCENRFNGFAYPAVPPGANRVWPLDLFHPFGARYGDAS